MLRPHPWVPDTGKLDNAKLIGFPAFGGRVLASMMVTLRANRGTLLILDKTIEFALNALKPTSLAFGKLTVERLLHLFPF